MININKTSMRNYSYVELFEIEFCKNISVKKMFQKSSKNLNLSVFYREILQRKKFGKFTNKICSRISEKLTIFVLKKEKKCEYCIYEIFYESMSNLLISTTSFYLNNFLEI